MTPHCELCNATPDTATLRARPFATGTRRQPARGVFYLCADQYACLSRAGMSEGAARARVQTHPDLRRLKLLLVDAQAIEARDPASGRGMVKVDPGPGSGSSLSAGCIRWWHPVLGEGAVLLVEPGARRTIPPDRRTAGSERRAARVVERAAERARADARGDSERSGREMP